MQWKRAKILLRESSDEGDPPTGGDGGRPGLAGRGCTPHSFSSCRKRMRRARWKKKALCVQILSIRTGLDKCGGRASRCGGNLASVCRVRLKLGRQRGRFPAFGGTVQLSGWSSDLAPSGPALSAPLSATAPFPGRGIQRGPPDNAQVR